MPPSWWTPSTEIRTQQFGLPLQAEVEPFGIQTLTVNPGFFRTELLTEESTNYAEPSIADYDERREQQLVFWNAQNGKQSGDPAKLAQALIALAGQEEMPRRFIAGADSSAPPSRRSRSCNGRSTPTVTSRNRWGSMRAKKRALGRL